MRQQSVSLCKESHVGRGRLEIELSDESKCTLVLVDDEQDRVTRFECTLAGLQLVVRGMTYQVTGSSGYCFLSNQSPLVAVHCSPADGEALGPWYVFAAELGDAIRALLEGRQGRGAYLS